MSNNNPNPFSSASRSGYSSISGGLNYSDEEGDGGGGGKKRKNKKTGSSNRPTMSALHKHILTTSSQSNRNFYLLLTLYLITFISFFSLHRSLYLLTNETTINQQETNLRISKVNARLDATISGIQRFNRTVTNGELVDEVRDLKEALNRQNKEVTEEMEETKKYIETELKTTKDEIEETVGRAQKEIGEEVVEVRKKVDEYKGETQSQFELENNFMLYQLAGTFTLIGGLISMWHVTSHLRNFHNPVVQRKILAILWMAPIYSTTSWFSLVFPKVEAYLSIVKDCYEAYVVYVFLSFLISVMGNGDREAVVDKLALHSSHLSAPFSCFGCCFRSAPTSNRVKANATLTQCQVCALQFVMFKPVLAALNFSVNHLHLWQPDEEGKEGRMIYGVDWKNPTVYILVCTNLSVSLAFFGLLKFYHLVAPELQWCRPWPKFLCIKGVVFATFWQGLAINILVKTAGWAKQAQSFLICIEMLIASIAHFYVFPHYEWESGYVRETKSKTKFGDNLALRDFIGDLKVIMGGTSKK
eukprot:CAMPEP_0118643888 /NCGR_PEP_ID=MMETSP0785-20121206/6630_1 /TAXON_ID=91992 /ORGANISM="Bolidomonas pacifica, Strain CCMP 1866" /LENGTH=528 /DNA_ID=CAMNT_0006535579 /DNA_START=75 /DNA_END=1658 /DNA_ORIENTATION=-